ncbi:MAG TPA: hypothetical protein VF598_02135 [Hymenobacter sp.]
MYHDPVVIRALFAAAKALEQKDLAVTITNNSWAPEKDAATSIIKESTTTVKESTAAKPGKPIPTNAGVSWTPEADQELAAAYDSGFSVNDLAKTYQRTTGSIRSRLMKLGKLPLLY